MTRAILAALVAISAAAWSSQNLQDAATDLDDGAELRLFPSGRLVNCLTLGQPTLLADIAWLQAIQYYGKHRLEDRRYPLAEHLFNVVTTIDPHFRNAYIFGALVLEDETGSLEKSRDLFARGMRANPNDWTIAFHKGFLEYLRGDMAIGAAEMDRAAGLPDSPPYVRRMAAHAYGQTGREEMASKIWEEIARESRDPAMRALAEQRLLELKDRRKSKQTVRTSS